MSTFYSPFSINQLNAQSASLRIVDNQSTNMNSERLVPGSARTRLYSLHACGRPKRCDSFHTGWTQ